MDSFLQQILSFTSTFNISLVILLFIICSVGEFSFSVPYLLETVWLLTGYHLGNGTFSYGHVSLLWLTAQAGRQTGAVSLYFLSRLGSTPIMKLYNRYLQVTLSNKLARNNSAPSRFIKSINYLSPFSIAMGRLFWLRIPITLTLGIKRKPKVLAGGILISSLVWDSIYISVGWLGAAATLPPLQMVLYSLIGLTTLYTVTLLVRHIPRRHPASKAAEISVEATHTTDPIEK